jgi:hypothetical protein
VLVLFAFSEYEQLQNQISNAKLAPVIKAEGVPRFYLKAVALLGDFVELVRLVLPSLSESLFI